MFTIVYLRGNIVDSSEQKSQNFFYQVNKSGYMLIPYIVILLTGFDHGEL
jgi:hypothetical protein